MTPYRPLLSIVLAMLCWNCTLSSDGDGDGVRDTEAHDTGDSVDGTNSGSGAVTIQVYNPDGLGFPASLTVYDVRFRVYQDGIELVALEWLGENDTTRFTFSDQPDGPSKLAPAEDYQIVVEGVDVDGNIRADGATPLFDLSSEDRVLEVYVSRLNNSVFTSALSGMEGAYEVYLSEFEGPAVATSLGLEQESLGGQRAGHATVELPDGRIAVVGGARLSQNGITGSPFAVFIDTIEVFDPLSNNWTLLRDEGAELIQDTLGNPVSPPMRLSAPRAFLTATLIDDRRILVVGGFFETGGRIETSTASEIIDLEAGTIEVLDDGMQIARAGHSAHVLNGRVFVIGGFGGTYSQPTYDAGQAQIEVFDPEIGYFDFAGDSPEHVALLIPRGLHTGTTVQNGIVIAGGRVDSGITDTIEFFTATGNTLGRAVDTLEDLQRMETPRFGHSAILMEPDFSVPSDERVEETFVALVGGYTSAGPGGNLLFGSSLTTSVRFFNTWALEFEPAFGNELLTARAYLQLAETTIMRDLLILGGYTDQGVTTSIERLMRNSEGGFPHTRIDGGNLQQPRVFAGVALNQTHNVLVVAGWDGTNSDTACETGALTTGCTTDWVNPGELYYLGYVYDGE